MTGIHNYSKIAFAFPGVGVAPCGREAEFYRRHHDIMGPHLARASEAAGLDLEAALDSPAGAPGELASQLLGHAYGCAMSEALRAGGLQPVAVLGYSMGLYAALCCARVLTFAEGLRLTAGAFAVMAETCPPGQYGMAVVVGLTAAEVLELAAGEPGSSLELVNHNNPTSLVLAGQRDEVARLAAAAREQGALKAELLEVSLPYHHPRLLGPAGARLDLLLGELDWRAPACPVVSCLDGAVLRRPEELRRYTARNIASPVRLAPALAALEGAGVEAVVECGVGVSLTQNARMAPASPPFFNLKKLLAAERR